MRDLRRAITPELLVRWNKFCRTKAYRKARFKKARILADNKGYFVMCDSCEARTAQFLHNNNTDDIAERCAVMNWNQRY